MMRQRELTAADRPAVAALLESLPAFTAEERAVALELVDTWLARTAPDEFDYRFILTFEGGPEAPIPIRGGRPRRGKGKAEPRPEEKLAGYLCYGRTPMTQRAYDLYWIATSPDFARSGVARELVASMEGEVSREGGGIIRVETGSREGHGAAVHFYDALGFARVAVIPAFYAPGDALLVFSTRVSVARPASFDELDETALYDAAFGYRDYVLERDFLFTCAKRFGEREVKRVLGWACGPARHMLAFADAGVTGVGVDGSEAMVAYARKIAGPRGEQLRFLRADLDERPDVPLVDLSFVPLSAIHTLTTPEAIDRHLRAAAALLEPGGIHIIEATHPADITPNGVNHTEWTEVRGDQIVDARFRMHIERIAPERDRLVPVLLEVICTLKNAGHTNGNGVSTPKVKSLRQEGEWFIPELEGWLGMIAKVPELQLVATIGDFNADVPFEHSQAWRLILVLKKV